MERFYDFKKTESDIAHLWEERADFSPKEESERRTFSMFLVPPNASGPMHIGNALMIAIQDVLARYHRARGDATVWVPGTDHGGYETQVTYERELERAGRDKSLLSRKELVAELAQFVEGHNETIRGQIKALGASVDWSRFRFTLDEASLRATDGMFRRMVADGLIYREPYMVHYCTACATVLADIELKETEIAAPLYNVRFTAVDGTGELMLPITRPEFIYAMTHVLVHPQDVRYAHLIGATLKNPATGEPVSVVASKRKFDPQDLNRPIEPFCPSHNRYDYEYAIRNGIPARDLLDWQGAMLERYPGMKPALARVEEVRHLEAGGHIESVEEHHNDTAHWCKKGHPVDTIIRLTWFVRLDDAAVPLRQPTLDALAREKFSIHPQWRTKGLVEWIGKMHDWPIARQNAWGIRIPLWYEVKDASRFMVWFVDAHGVRRHGSLKTFLDEGIALDTIVSGIERVYADGECSWTLEPEAGKSYVPETDTFDTWFSSGAWSTIVYGEPGTQEVERFYPSDTLVIGHDLLRLSVARELVLSRYLQGNLPFRQVYFHRLIKGADGQKMSKSLGNAITLDEYLTKYGADVTRMALVSYTGLTEDFFVAPERLGQYGRMIEKLWMLGRMCDAAIGRGVAAADPRTFSTDERALHAALSDLFDLVGMNIARHRFAEAQEQASSFCARLEEYTLKAVGRDANIERAMAGVQTILADYLILLHPFMPFATEAIHQMLSPDREVLAHKSWKRGQSRGRTPARVNR